MSQSSKCHRAHTSKVMTNVFNYNEVFKFCLINQSRIWNYNRARNCRPEGVLNTVYIQSSENVTYTIVYTSIVKGTVQPFD
jgi:hypothetical protein